MSDLQTIDLARLTGLVQCVLDDEMATITNWSHQALDGGFSGSAVHRVQGQAQTAKGRQSWSLILKVISAAGGGQAPTDFDYWQREALLYQSGLLAALPTDLITPRCYAVVEVSDQSCWLWLEDMGATDEGEWPLEQYGVAARHLGQMNGAYLVGRALPQQPWLRQPDVRQRLTLAAPGIPELPRLRHHPLFAELWTDARLARVLRLWEEREQFLAVLDRLPQTFCHRDAFRRNLMARQDATGRAKTVLFDWGSAGLGLLGEELVPLFAATLNFVAVDIGRIPMLEQLIFAGYLAGLRAAGWQGDERLARFGFTALAALKIGVAEQGIKLPSIARRAAALPPDAEPPRLLSPGGYQQAAAKSQHLLELGDEARDLLNDLA
ncbi:MAG: phosphotransferase [Caldilineaceae bacterium]